MFMNVPLSAGQQLASYVPCCPVPLLCILSFNVFYEQINDDDHDDEWTNE